MNTNELRNITHIVDVPKMVSILKEKGYMIHSERQRNGTTTYTIPSEHKYVYIPYTSPDGITTYKQMRETDVEPKQLSLQEGGL